MFSHRVSCLRQAGTAEAPPLPPQRRGRVPAFSPFFMHGGGKGGGAAFPSLLRCPGVCVCEWRENLRDETYRHGVVPLPILLPSSPPVRLDVRAEERVMQV